MEQNVFDVLKERGFIEQTTHEAEIRELLGKEKVTFYIGFDATADSLTAYADQVTAVVCRHFDAAAQHSNVVDLYKSVGICCQRADRISAAKIMADGYVCKYNIFHFRIIRCIITSEHCKQSGLTDAVTAVV